MWVVSLIQDTEIMSITVGLMGAKNLKGNILSDTVSHIAVKCKNLG